MEHKLDKCSNFILMNCLSCSDFRASLKSICLVHGDISGPRCLLRKSSVQMGAGSIEVMQPTSPSSEAQNFREPHDSQEKSNCY